MGKKKFLLQEIIVAFELIGREASDWDTFIILSDTLVYGLLSCFPCDRQLYYGIFVLGPQQLWVKIQVTRIFSRLACKLDVWR